MSFDTRILPGKNHEDLIQEKERSMIVPLSGNHYVYYKHGSEIAKTVTDWSLDEYSSESGAIVGRY